MIVESFNSACGIDHDKFDLEEYGEHLQDFHGRCANQTYWIGRDLFCFEQFKHEGECNYNQSGFPVNSMGEVMDGYSFP